jgi:alpha-methylacyl-CoA racemase
MSHQGPLAGVKVLEFAGIGPSPFCAMLLADMGASVVTVDKPGSAPPLPVLSRGKASIVLDLKDDAARRIVCRAATAADVLIEGFRPGVMERLGLGPETLLRLNVKLIYGRMTGWGQSGPAAHTAGHDLSYIAVTGALAGIGEPDRPPPPPLNLVGDYGGGSLYLAMGVCAALYERERSGRGQIIDAAMVDGVTSLLSSLMAFPRSTGIFDRTRSVLGGASPYYRCYTCADGKYVAVAALEPKFFGCLVDLLGVDRSAVTDRENPSRWPTIIALFAARFASRSRDEWATVFAGTDACVAPVLSIDEAPQHPQLAARGVFIERGMRQPAPAPRFERTASAIGAMPAALGHGGEARLREWGVEL